MARESVFDYLHRLGRARYRKRKKDAEPEELQELQRLRDSMKQNLESIDEIASKIESEFDQRKRKL